MKRLNGFLESNREELENNSRCVMGYLPKGLNISGNLAKDTSHHILRRLLNGGIFQVAIDSRRGGEKDLDIETAQKAWKVEVAEYRQMKRRKAFHEFNKIA